MHHIGSSRKQAERQAALDALPAEYSAPLTDADRAVQRLPLAELVARVQSGSLSRGDVLLAYGRKALLAQARTNCLAEVMLADAARDAAVADSASFRGPAADTDSKDAVASDGLAKPLAGVVVSLKDSETVAGYDATIGFSAWVGNRVLQHDSHIVRLLRDAGALLPFKTTVPTTLLTAETKSDVFGRTTNPYNPRYASGGSTGGGAALLACGGSQIEIGTDLAGSLRTPAHYSGVYTVKGSAGRFPAPGGVSSVNGLEGVQLVAGPLARSLDDLEEFWKRVMEMKPWNYDHSVSLVNRPSYLTLIVIVSLVSAYSLAPSRAAEESEVGSNVGRRYVPFASNVFRGINSRSHCRHRTSHSGVQTRASDGG